MKKKKKAKKKIFPSHPSINIFFFFLSDNGFVYGAGNANLGMTGTFTVPTLTSLTNIVKVLSGSSAVIALKSDGTLWCSGTNT